MVHILVNVLLGSNVMAMTFVAILMNVNAKKIFVPRKVEASRTSELIRTYIVKPVKEEICSDTEGSYECICNTGYELKGSNCIDINECLNDQCSPDYDCVNSIGSYFCDCTEGYAYYPETKELVFVENIEEFFR